MGSKLFEMFRDVEVVEISDGELKESIAFRALNYLESLEIAEAMTKVREAALRQFDTSEHRAMLLAEVKTWSRVQVIDRIITLEKPTAVSVLDLAPEPPSDSGKVQDAADQGTPGDKDHGQAPEPSSDSGKVQDAADQGTPGDKDHGQSPVKDREKVVLKRWEADRRGQLDGLQFTHLQIMMVDRLVQTEVTNKSNATFTEESLLRMVVDPEDHTTPMLSSDPSAPNFLGRLMPVARMTLVAKWQEFTFKTGAKQIRQMAKSPGFLPSGGSREPAPASPGGTTEIPPSSLSQSSASIPSASG